MTTTEEQQEIGKLFKTEDFATEYYDRIRNFTLLWNIFERYGFKKKAKQDKIPEFITKLCDERVNFNFVQEEYDYFRNRYFKNGESNTKFDALNLQTERNDNSTPHKIIVKEIFQKDDSNSLKQLEAVLHIVFRFRNNLFHGEKQIIKLKYQDINFERVNNLLVKILSEMKNKGMFIE